MKKAVILYVLATAMLFAACGDSNDEATPEGNEQQSITTDKDVNTNGYYTEGSLIEWFYEPEIIDPFFQSPSKGFSDNLCFYIFAVKDLSNITEKLWGPGSEKYKEYVEYYGDTIYPKNFHSLSRNEYDVSAMPLESINITADKDFDSEHPAGASLNDLFVLQFSSAYNVIKSNYDSKLDMTYYFRDHPEDAYEITPLSEFKPINLLFYRMYLHFNKLPEKLGTYEFTITFNYGNDPISGREAKVAPAVVKAEFTEKDYVTLPKH